MNTSSETKKRKPPAERRGDIIAAAAYIALAEGLQSITLRRVADELNVVPGLVNHYFPVVDDLVAASFGEAAADERTTIFAAMQAETGPVRQMRMMLKMLLDEEGDAVSLLWLDAWQASRNRQALKDEVSRQMRAWQEMVRGLIQSGADAGAFQLRDPEIAAIRILALVDGLSVQAAIRHRISYTAVREMVVAVAESELGLKPGRLQRKRGETGRGTSNRATSWQE